MIDLIRARKSKVLSSTGDADVAALSCSETSRKTDSGCDQYKACEWIILQWDERNGRADFVNDFVLSVKCVWRLLGTAVMRLSTQCYTVPANRTWNDEIMEIS